MTHPDTQNTFRKAALLGRQNLGWSLSFDDVRDLDDPEGRYYWYNFVWLHRNHGAECDDAQWAKALTIAGLTQADIDAHEGQNMAALT